VRRASRLLLSNEEVARLRLWLSDPDTPTRVRDRAKILLWAAAGHTDAEIAGQLGKDPATVALWRRRFGDHRLSGGLRDAPRPGRRPSQSASLSDQILDATYNLPPDRGHRWTTRTLASRFGVNHMLVHRVWRSQGIGTEGAATPPDRLAPRDETPFVDLLGVLWRPPTRAVILGVDLSGERRSSYVEPLLQSFRSEVSGGYLLHSVRGDPEDLIGVLEGLDAFRGRTVHGRPALGDLLILLRDIDETAGRAMRIHVLADRRISSRDLRLAQWLRTHPRFVLHRLPSDASWPGAVREFLQKWRSVQLAKGSFQGVSAFTRSAARFAAGHPPPRDGLLWSVSLAVAPVGPSRLGEISVTGLSDVSIPMPAPPTKSISTSEIGANSEKFRLRTERT
jgi:hypothetical protein